MEKVFSSRIVVLTRIGKCENCAKFFDKVCEICQTRTRQTKEIKSNFNELKRKPPNEFEHMLLQYETSEMRKTEVLLNEIFADPPNKNYANIKTDVFLVDDNWGIDFLDLNDKGPKNFKKSRYVFVVFCMFQ